MVTVGLTHWADILTVILYFVFVLGVGIWSIWNTKRGNVENYFLAGRNMPWIAVGASIFGSNIGSEHFIGLAGAGAASGIVLILFEWIPALIIQVLSWVFLPVYISAGVYTLPEYMGRRFGGKRLRTYLSLLALVLHILTRLSTTIFSGAIYIQLALGWDMYPSIIGVLFVTAVFTIAGGLTAVMYTDTAQSIIIIIGAFLVMGLSLDKIGGYENLVPAYMNATPAIRDTNTTCGIPRSDAMSVLRDPATGDFPWTAMILQCSLVSSWYWICDQIMAQRCLAAKNISHAKSGTLLGGYLKILPLFIMIIPGMISRILYTDDVACVDSDECMRACKNPVGCSNIAYPKLVLGILPEGARGLIMAAMLSAIVTSLTSIFNSASTVFTMDFWRRVRPNAKQRELLIVGRVYIICLCIVTILWIPIVKAAEGGQLFSYMVIFEGFIAAPLPVLFLLAVFWKRTTEMIVSILCFILAMALATNIKLHQAAFYGLLITHVFGVIRLILETIYPVPRCGEPDTRPAILSQVHGFYFSQIMMLFELIIIILISLYTKPNSEEQLHGTTFYTKLQGNASSCEQKQESEIATVLSNGIIRGTETIELSAIENEHTDITDNLDPNITEIHNSPKEMLVQDDVTGLKHVTRRFTTAKVSRLFFKLCGVPEGNVNTAVEISIESRKSFLTETSELVKTINTGFALALMLIITFLVGYFH